MYLLAACGFRPSAVLFTIDHSPLTIHDMNFKEHQLLRSKIEQLAFDEPDAAIPFQKS
jgi:hypothetical protein